MLLAGPAIRAVASAARQVTVLCGPAGREAASLLPGVDRILQHRAEWIVPDPAPLDPAATCDLVERVVQLAPDEAIVLTSFHQSALPLALLLRLAGVPVVAAISDEYPGSLLDVRHHVPDDLHEVERSLSLVATLGYHLPAGDDGRLLVDVPGTAGRLPVELWGRRFVVVHPGASVPARRWPADAFRRLVEQLARRGIGVAVTGSEPERSLTAFVAGDGLPGVVDLGGRASLGGLAALLRDAAAAVVANTGPAHLAAAVGTPVVSLFAATVPSARWRPWQVPSVVLGNEAVPCAGCRAKVCAVAGHPCLDTVAVGEVLEALDHLGAGELGTSGAGAGDGAPAEVLAG